MSKEIAAANTLAAQIRYNDHKDDYEAIFGKGNTWCRAIPWVK